LHDFTCWLADIYVGVFIIRELKEDMRFSADEERFKFKYVWQCLTDWKTYVAREFLRTKISHCDDIILSWNMFGNVSAISYWYCSSTLYSKPFEAVAPYSHSHYSRQQSSMRWIWPYSIIVTRHAYLLSSVRLQGNGSQSPICTSICLCVPYYRRLCGLGRSAWPQGIQRIHQSVSYPPSWHYYSEHLRFWLNQIGPFWEQLL
jgi:hypothetical protein